MATTGVGSTNNTSGTAANNQTSSNTALENVDINQFLKLMIAELQNQDPLNPMDNSQMMQQISTMREIAANSKLTDTLDAMSLGQNISSASNLIGKMVRALTDDNEEITGVVDKVSILDNVPTLHIGDQKVQLKNVREIVKDATPAAA